ncbi:hypothetical protein [Nonomuraea africana]|uniref:Amidohydrolase n=1 Tax=Nonomuraea africana TaxID=46171 RepID=A0ABR9KCU2_9ACTN|nr:hypothetical protein [Nonomuraea africana]MBE1559750.1 hypothetical protein [Nonomuraea africana]
MTEPVDVIHEHCTGRIDVHQHMVPEPYARWLRANGVDAPGGGRFRRGARPRRWS